MQSTVAVRGDSEGMIPFGVMISAGVTVVFLGIIFGWVG